MLGAWDSDPDQGIISYLTPIGQALLNRKVGDQVEFELHDTKRRLRIESIEPAKITAISVNELAAETEAQPA